MASFKFKNEAAKDLTRLRPEDDSAAVQYQPASFHSDEFRPCLAMTRTEARPVLRSPHQLRLHTALDELNFIDLVGELNEAARLETQNAAEPILITTNGTILAGFGRWRLAIFQGRDTISCIEFSLSDDESLQFILTHHQTRRGWNAFNRIRLALALEPTLQRTALANMRAGGRNKGSANLPEAQQIDVRKEIAHAAGVGERNVGNVKKIIQTAHPRLLEALREGTLSINCVVRWCRLPKATQVEQFTRHGCERATGKIIRQSLRCLEKADTSLDVITVISSLQQQEERQPGSIEVRVGRLQRTVVLVGRDLLTSSRFQRRSKIR